MNLPPLPALPVLPPLPALPLPQAPTIGGNGDFACDELKQAMSLPLPFEPAPVVEEYKRTEWFPLAITPFHAGNYEVNAITDVRGPLNTLGVVDVVHRVLWDGREWADKLPRHATCWRGWDRSRWVAHRAENPPLPGWYPMRFPRADKKAPSYWDGVQWMYANPTTGEMLAYAAGPKWQAEWFHDGAP